jgi:hypothetical protein
MPNSEWEARARGFVNSANELLSGSRPYAPAIVFLGWQGAELGLKALAVQHNIVYSHDLKRVMDHLRDSNVLDSGSFTQISDWVVTATSSGSYNGLRYPTENAQFWERMPVDQIRQRVDAATQIVGFCEARLRSSGSIRPQH